MKDRGMIYYVGCGDVLWVGFAVGFKTGDGFGDAILSGRSITGSRRVVLALHVGYYRVDEFLFVHSTRPDC